MFPGPNPTAGPRSAQSGQLADNSNKVMLMLNILMPNTPPQPRRFLRLNRANGFE